MSKKNIRFIAMLLLVTLVAGVFAACGPQGSTEPAHVDYVGQLKLDMNSTTKKYEVKWGERSHIDGDTSHFDVDREFDATGTLKARYLAVDTPESTGQIEEWGKAASRFTREKLSTAVSIILESDSDRWNYDGNGRYLVWVWYKPAEGADYRCLNIELLQEGLGASSSASEGRYGESAVAAIAQANKEKLYMFSGEKDPDYPYDGATAVTLKELRTNIENYYDKETEVGVRVAFEGIVTYNSDYTAYVEAYDAETDMYYGMQVFYGYDSKLIEPLAQGNMVRIVGVVANFYGTWQVTSLKYNPMRPNDPANSSSISTGNPIAFRETAAATFTGDKTILVGEESKTFKYADLAISTSISMKNLKVDRIYTTTNPDASDTGAMTLTCSVDGITITVRTGVLKDESGNLITESYFAGKTIDVQGIVDSYEGTYQIRALSLSDFVIH